jgi:subtilisin family serine protease
MGKFNDLFIKDGRAKITIPILLVVLVLISLAVYFSFFVNPKTASQSIPPHAKNRLIVQFKESAKKNLKKEQVITGPDIGIASVTTINKKEGVKKIKKVIPNFENKDLKGKTASESGLDRIYTIEFNADKDINSMIDEYSKDRDIEYAEPDYLVSTQLEPNDPYYSSSGSWGQDYPDLWGIKKINSNIAWDISTGANTVVVAVIDTGIDYNHSDLAANIWTNADEVPNNGVDDDNNGYIDDYYGYDFYNYDGDPIDDHAHGTHCSGTIGGVGNNNLGVVGVNWNVKLMAAKFLSSGGSGYISDAVEATYYTVNNGARVLSNSWGGGGRSAPMQTAIDYAYSNNVVFVAAAGNSNSDAYNYTPAGLNHVMTIAATDYQDNKASFSSWGDVVEFAAPGVDILSLKAQGGSCSVVGGHYCRMSGTSMATPHAAGLAALIVSANPDFTPDQVQAAMQNGADDLGTPGKDIYFGYGRINAGQSLKPIKHIDGTIIKTRSAPQVYVLEGGNKRFIPNVEIYLSWFDWQDLVVISQGEMDSYPEGNNLVFRPGSLVKSSNNPEVYLIDGSSKKLIVNPDVFLGMGYSWSNIMVTNASELNKYNKTDNVSAIGPHINGTLVKTGSQPQVYLLDNGNKRPIQSAEVFLSRYHWTDITVISNSEMSGYTTGDRVGFRDGSLVKAINSPYVYLISGTTKKHITSPSVFAYYGYQWNTIIATTSSELNNYTAGESI